MAFIQNTPIYVWVILAFLLYYGAMQRKTRQIHIVRLFIAPIIFSGLIVQLILSVVSPTLALLGFVVGIVAGLFFGYVLWKQRPLLTQQNGQWYQEGSNIPLGLYLFIFICRYVSSASLHIDADIIQTDWFNFFVGLLTGFGLGVLFAIPLTRTIK